MKALLKSFTVPIMLSGGWGVITCILGYLFLRNVTIGYIFFYPILMTGVTVAASLPRRGGISHARAGLTGFVTGFIYLLVSPMFPVLASALAGAGLGGGLSGRGGGFGGLLRGAVSALKGMIILPLVIFSGELLGAWILILLNSRFLCLVFWGAWLGLGVCLIRLPVTRRNSIRQDTRLGPELDEFRDEAGDIMSELGELHSGIENMLLHRDRIQTAGFSF